MLLAFENDMPPYVDVAPFMRLKISQYSLRPMQCKGCWLFGHTMARCRNQVAYEYCAQRGHSKNNCTVLENENRLRCVNCRGRHEASSRLCPRYQENLDILLLAYSTTPSMTFKDAQVIYDQGKRNGQSVAPMQTATAGDAGSYAAVAARSSNRPERPVRPNGGLGPSAEAKSIKQSYNYNPNGVVLDKSELESLAFSHMVILTPMCATTTCRRRAVVFLTL